MLAQTITDYNPAAGDAWRQAVADLSDALPAEACDFVTPDFLGAMDAEEGNECQPLEYYVKLSDIELYVIGYKDTLAALEEAADLREDMADREWHSRGSW